MKPSNMNTILLRKKVYGQENSDICRMLISVRSLICTMIISNIRFNVGEEIAKSEKKNFYLVFCFFVNE